MDEALLTPFDSYNSYYKELHKQNVSMYFEGLVDKTGVDRDANKKTITDIAGKKKEIEELKKQRRGRNFLKILVILGMVVIPLLALVFWILFIYGYVKLVLPLIPTIALFPAYFLFIIALRKLRVRVNSFNEKIAKLESELNALVELSWKQMEALNKSYDWSMAAQLVNKTIPLLELDDNFNPKRYELLNQKYGLGENKQVNQSSLFVQSGSILGNPFVFSTARVQDWGKKTYTGHLTIHWVERYRDSEGNMRTRTRSETLTAYVTKPIPVYYKETKLIYGNEAAPNLSFSRGKSGTLGKSEKQIENMIDKEVKQIDKMAKKAIMKETGYTRIGNDEFESLFGGEDRDNEMEYRLLFTPLAQTNFIKLIKSQEPYGDDFKLWKHKKLNVVESDHSQSFSYLCDPGRFISNSYLDAKEKFEKYCNEYFTSMFFDFAPLLSIPIYQQYKTKDYIYKNNYQSNVTSYEHEVMANTFNESDLVAPATKTSAILKTSFDRRNMNADNVIISAHTFTTVERIEYVNVRGGDGRTHSVPVHWDEYVPLVKQTRMEVKEARLTRSDFIDHKNDSEFNNFLNSSSFGGRFSFQRKLLAVLLKDHVADTNLNQFSNCLKAFEEPLDETLSDFDDSELKNKMFKDDVVEKTIEVIKDIDKSNE